ncbi:anti-phage ZorAB system protein ZorA [Ferrimonas balearica]|uniref:anti-phage ZorAB system protein ZorA n=1 Tax=Ferrimonas balearica TaxID=44012 RepID=UPI001C99E4BA|nr:anti-phage ZorAB system protein ZorA [Ferrimonas balearica]MBY5990507.1 anti-phage defense ZorAB system protein ZorA [Ferrimonas balearica]
MQPSFSFSNLIPDFGSLLAMWARGQWMPDDTATLSAMFVLLLLSVFSVGLSFSLAAFVRARSRIGFYHNSLLGKVQFDTVHDQLHDINQKARDSKSHRHLWHEFTETLVEVDHGQSSHYHNTYDAEHFFNTTTLSRGASESRIAVAVPGFLTAIGVLGTFVGLQMGLSGLNLAENASVDELRASIGHMISGAAVAFTTSVWGVFLSLLFNFIEKKLDWNVRSNLLALQTRVDHLFPRITPENQLVKIAKDGNQSREALQGLADKIGDKMQVALDNVTQSIQTSLEASLENIMKPAIDKLVDVGTDTSSQALDNMLNQFMDSMGKEGNRQREAMDQASQQMLGTLEQLGTTLTAFMNRLEASEADSAQRQNQLGDTMANQLQQMAEHSSSHLTQLSERTEAAQQAMAKQVSTVVADLTEQQSQNQHQFDKSLQQMAQSSLDSSEQIRAATAQATESLTQSVGSAVDELRLAQQQQHEQVQAENQSLRESTEALLMQVNGLLRDQVEAVANLLAQGQSLQSGIERSASANVDAASKTLTASEQMRQVSQDINVFGNSMRDAANGLSGAITQAVSSTRDLAEQNQLSVERVESLRDEMASEQARLKQTQTAIDNTLATAGQVFADMRQHQQSYLDGLNSNVEGLVNRLNQLLREYSQEVQTQTTERMENWNQQTSAYTTQMTSAIEALAGAVDEIETKIQGAA